MLPVESISKVIALCAFVFLSPVFQNRSCAFDFKVLKNKQSFQFDNSVVGVYGIANADTTAPIVIDTSHYSRVFGEFRSYRVYLPSEYYHQPGKRYPVIYFFHGWSQRYFGAVGSEYASFDSGDDNGGDNIENFIKRNEVIVVKMDGYDRSPNEKYYIRPYSIGPVEKSYRQFPVYFPELVNHVDEIYHTIADRKHRAVSGLSMGGFMSFWIAGKYPHMISAVGNFCGSTEFEVGPRDFTVEYKHSDMYKNYTGVNVRLHYGDKDFIRSYHEDVNRVWMGVMDNYSYKVYDAAHSTCGMGDMFNFILHSFKNPPVVPGKWDHIDVYPDFTVWDYTVTSDRNIPGFTVLEDVDKNGFSVAVREYLPDGGLMKNVKLNVLTPGIYKKNEYYTINDIDLGNGKQEQQKIKSDQEGRLKITLNGSKHQVAIDCENSNPNLVFESCNISNADWITSNRKMSISISVLNKGFSAAKNVKATLTSPGNNVFFLNNKSNFNVIKNNSKVVGSQAFEFIIKNDSLDLLAFNLAMIDDNGNSWANNFEMPVKRETETKPVFLIADGRMVTVARSGTELEDIYLGAGNGDGIANPGESIAILILDKNVYRRTNLFSSDKYVNTSAGNARKSDNWSAFDYTGASNKYSIPVISSDIPVNHTIAFFGEYWLPGKKPVHIVKGVRIEIKVSGKDSTPPLILWSGSTADNTFRVKLIDGAKIKSAKATFTPIIDKVKEFLPPGIIAQLKQFTIELNDNGINGDEYEADNVFSAKIRKNKFCLYKVEVESEDLYGNRSIEKLKDDVPLF